MKIVLAFVLGSILYALLAETGLPTMPICFNQGGTKVLEQVQAKATRSK
jgi:hypothetical protein